MALSELKRKRFYTAEYTEPYPVALLQKNVVDEKKYVFNEADIQLDKRLKTEHSVSLALAQMNDIQNAVQKSQLEKLAQMNAIQNAVQKSQLEKLAQMNNIQNAVQKSQLEKKEVEKEEKTVKKGNHWMKMEEIILIGVVYDHLFLYGSLNTAAWKIILDKFKRSWDEYYRLNGKEPVNNHRSACALLRHYKVMKQRSSDKMLQGLFKSYFRTWDKTFGHLFEGNVKDLNGKN